MIDYIKRKDSEIKLSITTNGQKINDELLEKIIKTFEWITFSIDSSNEKINEKIGRGKNHLSTIIKLLDKSDNKIKIKINTVANKYNLIDLDNIYSIISKYNISRWKIFRFYPLRKGKENKNLFYLNDIESKEIEYFIDRKIKNAKMKIHYNDLDEFKTSYFNIYPDGSVENSNNENIGNLLYDDIHDILRLKIKNLLIII